MNWTCAYCETLNPEHHTLCEVCRQPVPSWACTDCGESNFAWSEACTFCGKLQSQNRRYETERITTLPAVVLIDPTWQVPGTIVARGVRTKPVYRELKVTERFFWKNTPFLASEARYKDVVWEGDKPVRIRKGDETESYIEEKHEEGHPVSVTAVSIGDTGDYLYSTDRNKRVIRWDSHTGEKLASRIPKIESEPFITTSQGIVLGGYHMHIRVWHHSGEVQFTVAHREDSPLRYLKFSGERDYLVAAFANGTLMVWRYQGGGDKPFMPYYTTRLKASRITAFEAGTHGVPRFAAGLENGEMIVWNVNTIADPVHRRGFTTPVRAIGFSAFGPEILMSDNAGTIYVFHDAYDKSPEAFRQKEAGKVSPPITCMEVVSPAGHLIAADFQGRLQIWDWMRRDLIKVVPTSIPNIHTLAVNAALRQVVVAGESGGLASYGLDDLLA